MRPRRMLPALGLAILAALAVPATAAMADVLGPTLTLQPGAACETVDLIAENWPPGEVTVTLTQGEATATEILVVGPDAGGSDVSRFGVALPAGGNWTGTASDGEAEATAAVEVAPCPPPPTATSTTTSTTTTVAEETTTTASPTTTSTTVPGAATTSTEVAGGGPASTTTTTSRPATGTPTTAGMLGVLPFTGQPPWLWPLGLAGVLAAATGCFALWQWRRGSG